MKDYYAILGVPENASPDEIKSAFRKLAFKHHPDTAAGNKQEAEIKFKEINEAYAVLSDPARRREYDFARQGRAGFGYSQDDIFRDAFANRNLYEEINRIFAQAGLRFDEEFINRAFFQGGGTVYEIRFGPGGASRRVYGAGNQQAVPERKPGWFDRLLSGMLIKLSGFALRHLFGIRLEKPGTPPAAARHIDLPLSASEASAGAEKIVIYKDGRARKFRVKIPAGVRSGTQIRLRNALGDKGDLYLDIKVQDELAR